MFGLHSPRKDRYERRRCTRKEDRYSEARTTEEGRTGTEATEAQGYE